MIYMLKKSCLFAQFRTNDDDDDEDDLNNDLDGFIVQDNQ